GKDHAQTRKLDLDPIQSEWILDDFRTVQVRVASSARSVFEPHAPTPRQPTAWRSRSCGLHTDRAVPPVHRTRRHSQGGHPRWLWQALRSDRSDAKTGHALPAAAPTPSIPMLSVRGAN